MSEALLKVIFFQQGKESGNIRQVQCAAAMPAKLMTHLKRHARLAGLGDHDFTMHSFEVRAVVAGAITGQDITTMMAKTG